MAAPFKAELRAFWDAASGWTIETPIALSLPQKAAACAWIRKWQEPRVAAWPRGDRREQATAALKALSPQTLNVRITAAPHREGLLFARD